MLLGLHHLAPTRGGNALMVATSISPAELPSAIAELSLARAAGATHQPSAYEALMLACIEHGRPTYAYRLLEEAAADGLRLSELSCEARSALTGLIPPEAEVHAADAADASEPRGELLADPPSPLWVTPSAPVREFDCAASSPDAADALEAAWAAVDERAEPVLFRGVGAHWPALDTWTLDALPRALRRGMVRVAPDSRVTFCRESHPDVRSGRLTPPSRTLNMDIEEFVDRLHAGRRGRAPLLYGDGERCYLQALAPHSMMRDTDFAFLDQASQPPILELELDDDDALEEEVDAAVGDEAESEAEGTAGCDDGRGGGSTGVLGRLWVSAPGTVSPLHFDLTDSYLCQVGGAKRLLLWPADALQSLEPFPPDDALARRLRVDVTGDEPPNSRLSAHARADVAAPFEAVLRPGDVLFFPANWAHHTEALIEDDAPRPSFSLGFRTDGAYLL